ncbi:MAG TPA: ribonuclease Z [Methanospirillum sp.]|uniref:ribonuclease Z n=1 Tax=Methanospirillum sp. TaxID=45200 RepID=UPI002BD7E755|nr:ribonuclease Z [Methanospirillum sp.]HWQ62918.1 ribonuclease Z [Methanospirillum sp.]
MGIIAGETLQVFFLGTSGALPTISRNLPCILIKWGSHDLLFDCGEGAQRQMMKARTGFSFESVFITHWHADHFLGLIGLLQTMSFSGREEPLVVYGPDTVHEMVTDIKQICRSRIKFQVESRRVRPGDSLGFDGYTIHAVATDHGIPGLSYIFEEDKRPGRFNRELAISLGVRPGPLFGRLQRGESVQIVVDGQERLITPEMIMGERRLGRKIIYTGDTRPNLSELAPLGEEADLLIHDATFDDTELDRAREFMHSTAGEAGRVAAALKAGHLALFHISTRYTSADQHLVDARKNFFGELLAPDDLVMLDVPFSDRTSPPFEVP